MRWELPDDDEEIAVNQVETPSVPHPNPVKAGAAPTAPSSVNIVQTPTIPQPNSGKPGIVLIASSPVLSQEGFYPEAGCDGRNSQTSSSSAEVLLTAPIFR